MAVHQVTATLGVPTIWNDVLNAIESNPGRWSFVPGMRIYSGGAAPPADMFRRFDRLGMTLQTGWGMTETSPLGSQTWIKPAIAASDADTLIRTRTSNGIALPLVEMRHVDGAGHVQPWDGQAVGELQVRGPWVTDSYIGHPYTLSATTTDGWLKTGDIVCFEASGYMRLVDRLKDLVKSGGEWISSLDMENALCDHPCVSEAAVIAVADARWGERPLAAVVLKHGMVATTDDIREHIANRYPKWMVPEHIELVSKLPKTSVGKLNKQVLRQQFSTDVAL
jgi:fatty-acyl-CoA synthase